MRMPTLFSHSFIKSLIHLWVSLLYTREFLVCFLMCFLARYAVTSLRYALHVQFRGFSCVRLCLYCMCFELYTASCITWRVQASHPYLSCEFHNAFAHLLRRSFPHILRKQLGSYVACSACIHLASVLFPMGFFIRCSVPIPQPRTSLSIGFLVGSLLRFLCIPRGPSHAFSQFVPCVFHLTFPVHLLCVP